MTYKKGRWRRVFSSCFNDTNNRPKTT